MAHSVFCIFQAGSWAGNLMLMHDHPDFASDIYTPLEALGAQVTVGKICHHLACSSVQCSI